MSENCAECGGLAVTICFTCNNLILCSKHGFDHIKKFRFHNINEIKKEKEKAMLQEAHKKNSKTLSSWKLLIIQEFTKTVNDLIEKTRLTLEHVNELDVFYSNLMHEMLDMINNEKMLQEDFLFYKTFEFGNIDFHDALKPVFRYIEKASNLIKESVDFMNKALINKTILTQNTNKKQFCNSCHAEFYATEDTKTTPEPVEALCQTCQHLAKCENCGKYVNKIDQILDNMCFRCQENFTRCSECKKVVANNLYDENQQKCFMCLGTFLCEKCENLFSKDIFHENFIKFSESKKCPLCLNLKFCDICDKYAEEVEMQTENMCKKCLGYKKCPYCKQKDLEFLINFWTSCRVCKGFEKCSECNNFYKISMQPDPRLCCDCIKKNALKSRKLLS